MASSPYKRVSRKRACRICGKPDWCSYTPDEKISFCARITRGSTRVSRTGWGVFYHEKSLSPFESFPFAPRLPPKKTELAPLEIRDFAYRKLIELAPACREKEIIDGAKGLWARKILDFENYGSLPRTQTERRDLAKEIRRIVNQKFPDYVRRQKASICGLPGFWLDKSGKVQLWLEKDYQCPMMLIPYRDGSGFVQACQIRFMCRKKLEGARYVWLSTPDKYKSAGSGSPMHFAAYQINDFNKPLLVTEGALKAATVKAFKTEYDVLASAGVACSHQEIVTAARFRTLFIAFDADYHENLYVRRAVARLLNSLYVDSAKYRVEPRVKILTWNQKFKGIDDALLNHASIVPKQPLEWFQFLSAVCRDQETRLIKETLESHPLQGEV